LAPNTPKAKLKKHMDLETKPGMLEDKVSSTLFPSEK
jgi:hypothetical protein